MSHPSKGPYVAPCKGMTHPSGQLFQICRNCIKQSAMGDNPPLVINWVDRVCPDVKTTVVT